MPKELAPDAALVAAFLSDISGFLDDEVDLRASIPLTRSVSDETPEITSPRVPKRQKEVWQWLRCQEEELAAKFKELHQRRRADSDSGKSAWREIAMRQMEGRRVSEAHQEKLKAAVKRRRELLQDVETTLHKRLKEVEATTKAEKESSSLDRFDTGDDKLFEAYIDELDIMYAKTDAVFQSCEVAPMTGPFLNTKPPKKRDGDTEYFENLGVLHVPFEYKRTCLALWEVTCQPYRQVDRAEYRGLEVMQNTIAVRFRVKCRLDTGGVVSLLPHFVSRRYVEDNRTVIVWRELWEGEGELEGMHSDETGWCIVQPDDETADVDMSLTNDDSTSSTLIRTCVRLVPMHFSSNVSGRRDFDEFTEVLVTSGKEDNLQVEQ